MRWTWIVASVLGLGVLSVFLIPAVAGEDSVQTAIDELNAKYSKKEEQIPPGPGSGPALTRLNESYEGEFAKIGTEAPNVPRPSDTPADDNPWMLPEGIHPANEAPPGYEVTNYWAKEFSDGSVIEVFGVSREGDEGDGGVYIADDRGETFYPLEGEKGPLTITGVKGSIVTLASGLTDRLYSFDYLTRAYS